MLSLHRPSLLAARPPRQGRPAFTLARRSTAGILAVAAVAGTTLIAAPPATAASYHCKSSSKSIDTANYSGPWADQWDVTTKLCARRSGSYVYAYAAVSWDGPVFGSVDDSSIFDSARFRLQIKKSQSGTDPVKTSKDYYGIEAKLENSTSNGNYNNSYTTGTISWKAGSGRGLADGVLQLDWRRCCGGYHSYDFSASPVV
ncbi:hypothetical protein [Streptomyces sp. NBC_00624]|uniref:hypothetical protein n=1 Tax=Streptomyces sp. NBC_00624 TaxID=2975791 RepID=UPI002F90A8DD